LYSKGKPDVFKAYGGKVAAKPYPKAYFVIFAPLYEKHLSHAPIQMVDLKQQYQKIKPEVDAAVLAVLESAAFITGRRCSVLPRRWRPTMA
jgi:hypothetical protein